MQGTTNSLDEFLGHVLRGAAKILGCNSINLVVINEVTRQMQVRLGVTGVNDPVLAEMEAVMGDTFRGLSVPLDKTKDSLIYRVWVEGSMRETSRLSALVGGAFPAEVVEQFERMIGEHRFIVVPAAGAHRYYGVLLFEKDGLTPFSRQQREVLLRYARRIGAIIENDLMGHRQAALQPPPGAARGQETSLEYQLLQLTLGDPVPTIFLDPGHRVTSVSEAAVALMGHEPDQLVGRPVGELFREPDAIGSILGVQPMTPGDPAQEARGVILRSDGSMTSARVESLHLVDDRDQLVGFLLLIHASNGYEAGSTERLFQQERLASMGEMAAALAHEIRNPLLAIGATLESLGREPMSERQRRLLDSAAREITRLDLALKKYLTQRVEMSFSPVRMAEVLSDVSRLLSGTRRLQEKEVNIQVDDGVVLRADYDSLKHMFFNLVLNALEVSPAGGGVTCRAEVTPRDISVFVEDRGPGLTASVRQCFQPFFTTKKNGTGLGLPVCQRIAQAHGGLVDLEQRKGGGCRAVVVLPRNLRQEGRTFA